MTADTIYRKYFGLRGEPFKFLPSETLFRSAAHLEGLAALEWAFSEPSGLTLLAGEVGTGKTMLIHTLVMRLNDEQVRIAQISNPTLNFDEMLRIIVQQIGVHPVGNGKLAHLQAIKTFISDPDSKMRVILIFDEAQGLSDETLEELRLLSNSRPPQRHALQIILVGQPELVQRLADPKLRALNQRIGARALLRPLSGSEVHDYVRYLLNERGASYEIFSPDALDEVAKLSGGLPRKINNLCHNSVLHAYAENSTVVERRHVRAASAEIENLLEVKDLQGGQAVGGRRGAVVRMRLSGKSLAAVGVSALAVIACALALEFAPGRWFNHTINTKPGVGHTLAGVAKPLSGNQAESQASDRTDSYLAKQSPASAMPNPAGAPSSRASLAQAPQSAFPAPGAKTSSAPLTNGATNVPEERPEATGYANRGAIVSGAAAPPSERTLTIRQERHLEYELKRGTASFEAGRYNNAIYHLKRALAVRPDNSEIGELLQRARLAQAGVKSGSPTHGIASPPETEDATEADAPDVSPPVSNISADTFARVVSEEVAEGDAYMRAGKYGSALRKFRTAAVLEPDNASIADRVAWAERAQTTRGN